MHGAGVRAGRTEPSRMCGKDPVRKAKSDATGGAIGRTLASEDCTSTSGRVGSVEPELNAVALTHPWVGFAMGSVLTLRMPALWHTRR